MFKNFFKTLWISGAALLVAIQVIVSFAIPIGLIWVAWHFISKYW